MVKLISSILLAIFAFSSCMDYATVKAVSRPEEKIALQDFYSPCCGSCGQRIVAEINGKQYALQVNCQVEDKYSTRCTPLSLGTQKQVLTFKGKNVIHEDYYKPVYDTIELKKMYTKISSLEYHDSSFANKPVIPLDAIDSLLIDKYYALTAKQPCTDRHLRLIKGFIKVHEDYGPIDSKKVEFKTKKH